MSLCSRFVGVVVASTFMFGLAINASAAEGKKQNHDSKEMVAPVVIVEPTPEYAEKVARLNALRARKLEEDIKKNIARLATSGWQVARDNLIKIGKPAVQHLIDALAISEEPDAPKYRKHTYQLQGPIRAVRQRPLADVAYETLHGMFLNNSTYKGKLPGRDQNRWQALWNVHGSEITFGTRWE